MPNPQARDYWDQWNLDRVRDGLVRERLGLCHAVLNELHALDLAADSRLLEVACGAGWVGERLFRAFHYLGLDRSEPAITAARARAPGARFESADFRTWNPPEEPFDAVICVDAIAYFDDQASVIGKFANILRPAGWLLITTVNPFCYSRMRKIGPPAPGQVRLWLTRRVLHQLLKRSGFLIRKSMTVLPAGDMGVLRWVNSRKLNNAAAYLLRESTIVRLKELLGLGQFRIVVAQLCPNRGRARAASCMGACPAAPNTPDLQ